MIRVCRKLSRAILAVVFSVLALSGCKTTNNSVPQADSKAIVDSPEKPQPLTKVDKPHNEVVDTLAKFNTISVEEYQIQKETLYRITFSNKLLFALDSDDTSKIDFADIQAFAQLYREHKLGAYLYVVGHTDSAGSGQYNQSLSARRGYTIASLLIQNGVAVDKIKVVAAGESIPVVSNDSAASRAKNRRVEILSSDNMTLGLEFFRQFDCSEIDPACRPAALPVFEMAMDKNEAVLRLGDKAGQRVETLSKVKRESTVQLIQRKALTLPIQIRDSLKLKQDIRKLLQLTPKYWFKDQQSPQE